MKRTFRQVVNDGWKILREDIYGVRGVIIALALYFLFFRYILRSICPVVLVTGFPLSGLRYDPARLFACSIWTLWEPGRPIPLSSPSSCWRRCSPGTGISCAEGASRC